MFKNCINKNYIIISFAVIFQIVLIFVFLTLFFFLYVVRIEKEQFVDQINIVIDSIIKDNILKNIKDIVPVNSNLLYQNLSGIIDLNEKKIREDSKKTIDDINSKNNKLKNNIFKLLYIILGSVILLSIILIILNVCLPVAYQIKEALWVVLFVAITEFAFLKIIASKYISADPYKIKRTIAKSVKTKVKEYI